MPFSDADITIHVSGAGEQWEYGQLPTCPTIERGLTGDGTVSWSAPFRQYVDQLPPRHASVIVEDETGPFHKARLIRRQPPDTAHCDAGVANYVAEGLAALLGDRKFPDSTEYGPTWAGAALALTAGGAVEHAFGFGGAGLEWDTSNPTAGTFTLVRSEQFRGRPAHDVINAMGALSAGSVTPYVWYVRNGIFTWRPLDLGPRYEISCADGAVVTPSDDATRLFTRILLFWGNGQVATAPETLEYVHLPGTVDITVNAGTEVADAASAQRLADALYARLNYIELGWSCTVTAPLSTEIRYLNPVTMTDEAIAPWRVNAGEFLRIPDFDHASRYGSHHPAPNIQLMTSCRWDGKLWTAQCGMLPPDLGTVARSVMYSGSSRTVHALRQPGLSVPTRDADKTPLLGPALPAPTPGSPPPIDNWIPPLSTEHKQQLITHEAPKPIKLIEKAFTEDGAVFAAGLLDTGIYCDDIPPCEIDNVFLSCSPLGSITVQVWTAQQEASSDGRGAFVVVADALVPETLVLTATISAGKFYQHRFTGATGDAKPRITTDAMLLYVITGTPEAVTSFKLGINGNRIVPGHPSGHDTAPSLGQKSV